MGDEVTSSAELSFYDDLDAALAHGWALLTRGVVDRRSAFHTPALATIDALGRPQVRTVVLRAASGDHWTVRFHTDRRGGKLGDLIAAPAVSLHVYDPRAKIQLRLGGTAHVTCEGALADLAWQQSRGFSRACYAQSAAPGHAVTDPAAAVAAHPDGETFGRGNFAAVEVSVTRVEWLYLAAAGHRRALFERRADGHVSRTWLAP